MQRLFPNENIWEYRFNRTGYVIKKKIGELTDDFLPKSQKIIQYIKENQEKSSYFNNSIIFDYGCSRFCFFKDNIKHVRPLYVSFHLCDMSLTIMDGFYGKKVWSFNFSLPANTPYETWFDLYLQACLYYCHNVLKFKPVVPIEHECDICKKPAYESIDLIYYCQSCLGANFIQEEA